MYQQTETISVNRKRVSNQFRGSCPFGFLYLGRTKYNMQMGLASWRLRQWCASQSSGSITENSQWCISEPGRPQSHTWLKCNKGWISDETQWRWPNWRIDTNTGIYFFVNTHARTHSTHTQTHALVHTCMWHAHTHFHTRKHTHIQPPMRARLHTHTHTQRHTHTHTHAPTRTHTYKWAHKLPIRIPMSEWSPFITNSKQGHHQWASERLPRIKQD